MGKQRTNWWCSQTNVQFLAEQLYEAGLIATSNSPDRCAKELLAFFKKPQRFWMEWEYLQKHKTLEGFKGEVRI